jgi:hypothetical protein
MPGLFSVLFAGMITLSRAGFGVEQANSSRYISHSLMLGLTALLALALTDDHSNRRTTPLLGGFLVFLTTISSFPQSLQAGGLSYVEAWAQGRHRSDEYRQRFVCQAQQAALAARQIRLLQPCKAIYPDQTLVNEYFQGNLEVQPLGWHQHLIQNAIGTTGGAIRHHVDQQKLTTATLQLQGWAFLANDPNQPLYLLADYGTQEKLGWPVDRPRRDVKRTHHIKNRNVGFDAALPRTLEGQPLRSVLLAGPKQSVQIWEDPNADG